MLQLKKEGVKFMLLHRKPVLVKLASNSELVKKNEWKFAFSIFHMLFKYCQNTTAGFRLVFLLTQVYIWWWWW